MRANGATIRAERKVRGWNQWDLAAAASVHRNTVQLAEYGRSVDPDTYVKLAAALDLEVSDIQVADNDAERAALKRQQERAHAQA